LPPASSTWSAVTAVTRASRTSRSRSEATRRPAMATTLSAQPARIWLPDWMTQISTRSGAISG
jgi:predicted secreted hydrolase